MKNIWKKDWTFKTGVKGKPFKFNLAIPVEILFVIAIVWYFIYAHQN